MPCRYLLLLPDACNCSPIALATSLHEINSLYAVLWAAVVKVQRDDDNANTVHMCFEQL